MIKKIQSIKKLRAIIIIDEIASWGGGTTPIFNLLRPFQFIEDQFKFVVLNNKLSFLKIIFVFTFQKNIIINGLDPLKHYLILFLCLLKKNVIIYPQTIKYQLDAMKVNSFKFQLLRKILKRKKIACVSELQKNYFIEQFQSSRIQVVYALAAKEAIIPDNEIKICMTGYYSKLKGVNFYSSLADRAKELGFKYQFFWLGDGPKDNLVFSNNVTWLGYSANPKYILSKMDLFFLSASEESIPLVILEALELHKKCVAYKNTGISDPLRLIPGCSVFDSYDVNNALEAIHHSLASNLDIAATDILLNKYTNRENIFNAFNSFLIE